MDLERYTTGMENPSNYGPTKFFFFKDLPAEIRIRIWRMVLPHRRVIQLAQRQMRYGHLPSFLKLLSPKPLIPIGLHICAESRAETLKEMPRHKPKKPGPLTFYKPAMDILYVPSGRCELNTRGTYDNGIFTTLDLMKRADRRTIQTIIIEEACMRHIFDQVFRPTKRSNGRPCQCPRALTRLTNLKVLIVNRGRTNLAITRKKIKSAGKEIVPYDPIYATNHRMSLVAKEAEIMIELYEQARLVRPDLPAVKLMKLELYEAGMYNDGDLIGGQHRIQDADGDVEMADG